MKSRFAIIASLLCLCTGFGSAEVRDSVSAIRTAADFFESSKDLQVDFVAESFTPITGENNSYKGKLRIMGPRFHLEVPGSRYISDGKVLWEHHLDNGQVLVKSVSKLEGSPLPGQVLVRFLQANPISEEKFEEGGKSLIRVRMEARDAMENLEELIVVLDAKDKLPLRIHTVDMAENEVTYRIGKLQRNVGLDVSSFQFLPPEGVEVIDMRE